MIWDEASIVMDRIKSERRDYFSLMRLTISTIALPFSAPEKVKERNKVWNDLLDQ